MTDDQGCRLYLITPPAFDTQAFSSLLREALEAGDVACLQLRLKDVSDEEILKTARTLMRICHDHDVAFIVNDRPDLAAELGADGVHIGDEDGAYEDARRLVGEDAVVGVSCYDSRQKAMDAGDSGADYIAFGAFFPTTTKVPKSRPEPEILEFWSRMTTVPCVAIGGITAENCGPLVAAGSDFLAVVNGVWGHNDGPGAAVRAFQEAIAAHSPG